MTALPLVACPECCEVHECPTCLELAHEDCDRDDCLYCRAQAQRRELQAEADANVEYYAPGGVFDNLFAGAFDDLADSSSTTDPNSCGESNSRRS